MSVINQHSGPVAMSIDIEEQLKMILSDSLAFTMTSIAMLFGILGQLLSDSPNTTIASFMSLVCLVSISLAALRTRSAIIRIKTFLLNKPNNISDGPDA